MIYRNYIGLDLQSNALRAVVLRRRRTLAELVAGRTLGLQHNVLSLGQKLPNILDPAAFSAAVREVLDPIAGGEDRIALALPEASGRLLLLQVDTPLTSRDEGAELLRWHLRDTLPADTPVQLDFQVLSRDENGRQRVVVITILQSILKQYEDVLAEAGYGAEKILFRSLCQHNFFQRRLDIGEDFLLVMAEGNSLVFQAYRGGELMYHRGREVDLTPEVVFRELSRVLAGEGARLGNLRREAVYLHASSLLSGDLLPVLESLFERPVRLLDVDLSAILAPDVSMASLHEHSLVAAIGAAEGLM